VGVDVDVDVDVDGVDVDVDGAVLAAGGGLDAQPTTPNNSNQRKRGQLMREC
jgi:hypothetical protein